MASLISFTAETTTTQRRSSIYTIQQKIQKKSITQTYFLVYSARIKLSREAARADYDLRRLVGHANMLDSLLTNLANAEKEQEQWLSRSLSGIRQKEMQIRCKGPAPEERERDGEAEDLQSSDESNYEEQIEPINSSAADTTQLGIDFDDDEDKSLALTRTVSRHSPPDLTIEDDSDSDSDSDSESEDEQKIGLAPNLTGNPSTVRRNQPINIGAIFSTTKDASLLDSLGSDGFYLPSRQRPTVIATY